MIREALRRKLAMRLPTILGCGLVLLAAGRTDGEAMMYGTFCGQVQASDLIVEGVVERQVEINQERLLGGPFVYTRQSTFRVSKVYKGDLQEGSALTVLSHQTFVCNTSRLDLGRPYILFLKRTTDGLVDIASGQGTYEIFEIGPNTQVAVNKFGSTTGGVRIERLRSNIAWSLRGPTSQPAEPTISAEQAVKIIQQTITGAGVDLTKYELTKIELLKIPYEFAGIAYHGDPMWIVEWTKPEAKGRKDIPLEGRVRGYIHAHTGKIHVTPWSLDRDRPSVEDVCRVFLATRQMNRHISSNANERIRIRKLSESEFRDYVPRVHNMFLDVRPQYSVDTVFFQIDIGSAKPLIMVLDPPGHVAYAGEMEAQPTGSQSEK